VEAVRRIAQLDCRECRQAFEQRFTASRMAKDYVRVYEDVMARRRRHARAPAA
jgi:hypothetical protein